MHEGAFFSVSLALRVRHMHHAVGTPIVVLLTYRRTVKAQCLRHHYMRRGVPIAVVVRWCGALAKRALHVAWPGS